MHLGRCKRARCAELRKLFRNIKMLFFYYSGVPCGLCGKGSSIVQKSRFSFKTAKREPSIVQESRFSFKTAKRESSIVQKSPFPFKNVKSTPGLCKNRGYPLKMQNSPIIKYENPPHYNSKIILSKKLKKYKFCEKTMTSIDIVTRCHYNENCFSEYR